MRICIANLNILLLYIHLCLHADDLDVFTYSSDDDNINDLYTPPQINTPALQQPGILQEYVVGSKRIRHTIPILAKYEAGDITGTNLLTRNKRIKDNSQTSTNTHTTSDTSLYTLVSSHKSDPTLLAPRKPRKAKLTKSESRLQSLLSRIRAEHSKGQNYDHTSSSTTNQKNRTVL